MSLRRERNSFTINSLMADKVSKGELKTYLADCDGMTDDEVDNVISVLGVRFEEEGLTDKDKLFFLLLACTNVPRQISLGTSMIEGYIPLNEALAYWIVVFVLGTAPTSDRNIARTSAIGHIAKIHGVFRSDEEREQLLEELQTEHAPFIDYVDKRKRRIDSLVAIKKNGRPNTRAPGAT